MTKYRIEKGKVYEGDEAISDKTLLDKLILLDEIEQKCKRYDITTLGGNLRFLADYFDAEDEENNEVDSEVQDSLHCSANIFGFLSQKIIGTDDGQKKEEI